MGAVSSKSAHAPPTNAITNSLEEIAISVNIQAITFGIATSMAYVHIRRASADPMWLRISVVVTWLFCTVSLVVMILAMYELTITGFDNPINLLTLPWQVSIALSPTFLAATIFTVRSAFLIRLWHFNARRITDRSWHMIVRSILLIFTALLTLFVMGSGILIGVRLFQTPSALTIYRIKHNFIVLFGGGILADVILAAMLCFGLHRSRSGLKRSDSVINRLIAYSLQACLFPTVVGIAALLAYSLSRNPLLYAPFYIQIGNLYLISLAATLNHRKVVQEQFRQPLELTLDALNSTAALDVEAASSQMTSVAQNEIHRPVLHEKTSSETLSSSRYSSSSICLEDPKKSKAEIQSTLSDEVIELN
ncbi:hypothetical protein DAEQUDRAFT_763483 [Daedalea quercina L-15889]|uniref:DUF6534 domain-containing protein n=1 Tax=Daedalea quercina L-15889 TaxID=1314783 RepID=A0A165SHI9_9APHY|nr:hypothetical protein DAEQUDRAFT_763483 [Daedalea quercina L-15889]